MRPDPNPLCHRSKTTVTPQQPTALSTARHPHAISHDSQTELAERHPVVVPVDSNNRPLTTRHLSRRCGYGLPMMYAYLRCLFEESPVASTVEVLEALLPWSVKPALRAYSAAAA